MKKKLPTLTIGIPAYNEEANIGELLSAIFNQKSEYYNLSRVIVITDGSTDSTAKIVRKFAKAYPKIRLIQCRNRQGKIVRLNHLFRMCNSKILVCLDGDIKFENLCSLDHLLHPFSNRRIHLVSGNDIPLKTIGFFNQVLYYNYLLWYKIRHDLNGGDTVHNLHGSVYALRDTLYSKCNLSDLIDADDHQIYFIAKKMGYDLHFSKSAKFIYLLPSNLRDYLYQASRYLTPHTKIAEFFGPWVNVYYTIPLLKKIRPIIDLILKHPVYIIVGISIRLCVGALKKFYVTKNSTWVILPSTKREISIGM